MDSHIHVYPYFVSRSQDMNQIAVDASKAGMRALLFKGHRNITVNAAHIVQRHIDGMRVFLRALLAFGITKEQIRIMVCDNPAKLMWLDDRSNTRPCRPTQVKACFEQQEFIYFYGG